MSETDLSLAIRKALDACGIWNIRIQSGTAKKRGYMVRLCPPGTPDIWTPWGWLEVKVESSRRGSHDMSTRQAQAEWHAKAVKFGVRVAVVCNPGEAIKVISEWRNQDAKSTT